METQTQEHDLIFEVRMAEKDHAAIIQESRALLTKMTTVGTVFFLALCFIMSFNLWYLLANGAKSERILNQANATVVTLQSEEADLRSIINTQRANRAKLNYVYSKVRK